MRKWNSPTTQRSPQEKVNNQHQPEFVYVDCWLLTLSLWKLFTGAGLWSPPLFSSSDSLIKSLSFRMCLDLKHDCSPSHRSWADTARSPERMNVSHLGGIHTTHRAPWVRSTEMPLWHSNGGLPVSPLSVQSGTLCDWWVLTVVPLNEMVNGPILI